MKFMIFAGLMTASSAFAWGPLGHRTTALIAEAYLTPQAAQEVRVLLDKQRLVDVATWADAVRPQPEFAHTGPYHFHNLPDIHALPTMPTYSQTLKPSDLPPGPQPGVVEAILEAEKVLVDTTATKERRQNALKFLVHFVGDVHQPLHVGQLSDRGGNSIKLKWNGRDSNLHQVWDSGLLGEHQVELGQIPPFVPQQPGTTPAAPATPTAPQEPALDPAVQYARWLQENYVNARPANGTDGRPDLWLQESRSYLPFIYSGQALTDPKGYYDRARPIADVRLRLAGVRIAETLNRLFANRRLAPSEMDLIGLIRKTLGDLDQLIRLDPQPVAPSPGPVTPVVPVATE